MKKILGILFLTAGFLVCGAEAGLDSDWVEVPSSAVTTTHEEKMRAEIEKKVKYIVTLAEKTQKAMNEQSREAKRLHEKGKLLPPELTNKWDRNESNIENLKEKLEERQYTKDIEKFYPTSDVAVWNIGMRLKERIKESEQILASCKKLYYSEGLEGRPKEGLWMMPAPKPGEYASERFHREFHNKHRVSLDRNQNQWGHTNFHNPFPKKDGEYSDRDEE